MGQCKTLDADVTIGCYYGDYSYVTTLFLRPFLIGTKNIHSHLLASE